MTGETMLRVGNVRTEEDLEVVRTPWTSLGLATSTSDRSLRTPTPRRRTSTSLATSPKTPITYSLGSPKSTASTPRSFEGCLLKLCSPGPRVVLGNFLGRSSFDRKEFDAASHLGPRGAGHTSSLRHQPIQPDGASGPYLLGDELRRLCRANRDRRDRGAVGVYPTRRGVGAGEPGGYLDDHPRRQCLPGDSLNVLVTKRRRDER